MLTGLIPDTGYMISVFSVNAKGQSDRMVLQAYTQKSDQLFETNESALTNIDGFQVVHKTRKMAAIFIDFVADHADLWCAYDCRLCRCHRLPFHLGLFLR